MGGGSLAAPGCRRFLMAAESRKIGGGVAALLVSPEFDMVLVHDDFNNLHNKIGALANKHYSSSVRHNLHGSVEWKTSTHLARLF